MQWVRPIFLRLSIRRQAGGRRGQLLRIILKAGQLSWPYKFFADVAIDDWCDRSDVFDDALGFMAGIVAMNGNVMRSI